jgi:basic membrane protein A
VNAYTRRLPLILVGVVLLGLWAVSPRTGTPSPGQLSNGQPATGQAATPPPSLVLSDPTPRIAIIYDAGGRGSAGFSELAWEGAKRAADTLGADLLEVTATAGETDADREARLKGLAEARYHPILVIDPTYAGPVATVAPKYPSIWFGIVDDGNVVSRNVIGIQFSDEQGSFLVGAAAALTSKTGKVGFIGTVQSPLMQKYEAGFTAGAKAANPRVKVQVAYSSPAAARNGALAIYDAGADVIFAAAGDASSEVIQAAHDRGLWAIGVRSDQYVMSDPSVRSAILTSMLERADVALYIVAMEVANGVPKDGNNVFGLDRGGVGFSTSGGFVDSIKAQLDAFAAKIAAGEILVPTTP